MDTRRVLVIGCGLIGTSVGLALRRAGVHVTLADHDPRALLRALRMRAGVRFVPGGGPVDVVVIATPPSTVVPVLVEAQRRGLGAVYTDVASAKGRILDEAERAGCDLASFVPGHPMAGRELSGAGAGRADLFVGRAWVLCPHPGVDERALRGVAGLAAACGAEVTLLPAEAHDRAAAAVSHVPLVVSAALAGRFAVPDADALALAGTGLRDVTRVAGSPAGLWRDILEQNAGAVAELLDVVAGELRLVADSLRAGDGESVAGVLAAGNVGRGHIVRALGGVVSRKAS